MIEETYARQQIRRLSGLSFFPTDPVAAKELVATLRDSAKDEATARAVVDEILATCVNAPKPAEIRRVARFLANLKASGEQLSETASLLDWAEKYGFPVTNGAELFAAETAYKVAGK